MIVEVTQQIINLKKDSSRKFLTSDVIKNDVTPIMIIGTMTFTKKEYTGKPTCFFNVI